MRAEHDPAANWLALVAPETPQSDHVMHKILKIKMCQIIAIIVPLLAGCATDPNQQPQSYHFWPGQEQGQQVLQEKLTTVHLGMKRQHVIDIMGQPTSAIGREELMEYLTFDHVYHVTLKNGRVTNKRNASSSHAPQVYFVPVPTEPVYRNRYSDIDAGFDRIQANINANLYRDQADMHHRQLMRRLDENNAQLQRLNQRPTYTPRFTLPPYNSRVYRAWQPELPAQVSVLPSKKVF